jgi:hypothetical protein
MSTPPPNELTEERIAAFSKEMGGGDQVKRKAEDFPEPSSVANATLKPVFADSSTNQVWTVEGRFQLFLGSLH